VTTIYDIVTENGKLLGPSEEFNQEQFQAMMRGELVRYARQKLVNTFIYAPNVRIAYPTGVSIQKYFFLIICFIIYRRLMANALALSEN